MSKRDAWICQVTRVGIVQKLGVGKAIVTVQLHRGTHAKNIKKQCRNIFILEKKN